MLISPRTRATAVTNAANALGVPLPADYLEEVDQAEAFLAAAGQTICTRETLHRAVLDFIEAGRDYVADPRIQEMSINAQLTDGNILAAARTRSEEMILAALNESADLILGGWADQLDEHTANLVTAAEAGLNLKDAAAVVAHGGKNMDRLYRAQVAVKAWSTASAGFFALAAAAGVRINVDPAIVLTPARVAELAPAFELARDERTEVAAWSLARTGIPLQLATLGEFTERAAQYQADREAEARDYQRRANAAGFER